MPTFAYIALDRQGRQTAGTLPADNRGAALDLVINRGLSPVSVKEEASAASAAKAAEKGSTSTKVSHSAVESFTRELANLLAAGLSLSKALHLLRREASNPAAKNVWTQIHDDVVGGMPLAEALAKWPKAFSTVYVAMVRAGEAGGFLHVVLQQISDFRSREQELKGKVKAAMVYPCVLAVLAVGVLTFMLTFFIPRFAPLFAQFGADLPFLTKMIVAVSDWLRTYGLLLGAAVVVAIVLIRRAIASDSGKRFVERALLKAPIVGKLAARFGLVRFARML